MSFIEVIKLLRNMIKKLARKLREIALNGFKDTLRFIGYKSTMMKKVK